MNLQDLLGINAPRQQAPQDNNSLGMLMQFLQQGKTEAPQMPPINLPDPSNNPYIQLAAQRQDEAEKLKARREQLINDAKELSGKGQALTADPQVQAMIDSGNPQEVALGMKLAEEYKNKQIAGQFDEKISYKDWLEGTPKSRESMSEFMKLSHPGTNIYTDSMKPPTGYRWNGDDHTSVLPLIGGPEDQAAKPLTESQAKQKRDYAVMQETSKQIDDFHVANPGFDFANISNKDLIGLGLSEIDNPFTDSLGLTPLIEKTGKSMVDPKVLEYYTQISRWNEIYGRDKSGGAIHNPEYRKWLAQMHPWAGDTPEMTAQKNAARHAHEQAMNELVQPELRQQNTTGGRNPAIDKAAQQLGLPLDHPAVQFATQGLMPGESAGDPNALSYKGAGGILQVMPGTQQEVLPGSDPRNPEHQAMAGLLYAKKSLEDAGGDVNEAARRYFAGPGGYQNLGATDGDARHKGTTVAQYGKNVEQRMASPGPRKDRVKHPIVEAVTKNSPANKAAQKQAEEDAAILKQYGL